MVSSGKGLAADRMDLYDIIGCTIDSSKEDISSAARRMSLKYHPDKNPSPEANAMFVLLQEAKNILLDDEKRRAFDDKLKASLKRKEYDSKRMVNMDASRKRMKQELEERMGAVKHPQTPPVWTQQSAPSAPLNPLDAIRRETRAFVGRMKELYDQDIQAKAASNRSQSAVSIFTTLSSREPITRADLTAKEEIVLGLMIARSAALS